MHLTFTRRCFSFPNTPHTLNGWEGLQIIIKHWIKPSAAGVGQLLVMSNFSRIFINVKQDTFWRHRNWAAYTKCSKFISKSIWQCVWGTLYTQSSYMTAYIWVIPVVMAVGHVHGGVYFGNTRDLLISSRKYVRFVELFKNIPCETWHRMWINLSPFALKPPAVTTTQMNPLICWTIDNPYMEHLWLNCKPKARQTKVSNS